MVGTRDIRTNQQDISCDVCGRTLLRGERAEPFLAGGSRRQVCELCTARAQQEGWIRESGADELTLRSSRHEGRGRIVDRLRARRERAREVSDAQSAQELAETGAHFDSAPGRASDTARPEVPRSPRQVRAVPTNAELKMQRALEVFNASDHVRTVGGVARSLGAPAVSVRPLAERPSVVTITVMWELSWYRFEVDLSDEGSGVRREAQGAELGELADDEHVVNAAADERGGLHLAAPAA
ncbi:MAG: hypothetical protein H0U06_03435 [Solirubrobacterales bacterium]|nr:hypothetical protein [Solirubrobacterales bacterium]